MTIYDQIKTVMQERKDPLISPAELKDELYDRFGTNPKSVIISDYCYNLYNKGIAFDRHLFERINRATYKYLGENYPYTGLIFQRPRGSEDDQIVGEWQQGKKTINTDLEDGAISTEQMKKLFEEYSRILNYEINVLGCQPTEVRHLLGRLGEFYCAIYKNGHLAKEVNQHGFDVWKGQTRISVKTTAQTKDFITINSKTFDQFDYLFVLQYINDEFHILYDGPKEPILKIARVYKDKYEVSLSGLKRLVE
ncbi:DUF7225 domain-containing protein [Pelagirhabdus alkalitolerans]|nr:hypothetical protein [Pelagirhabdus alkalitolerans]